MEDSIIPLRYWDRPVAIIGCGVMGRRIALIWAESGYNIHIFDVNFEQVEDFLRSMRGLSTSIKMNSDYSTRNVLGFNSLAPCVKGCWLVIEAIPEHLESKIDLFKGLETIAPPDAILATNSSSYNSSLISGNLSPATRSRFLNTHYHMPPQRMIVELMTCGSTDEEILTFMKHRQEEIHTVPYIVRRESTGFILNRIWAAIKREVLSVLSDGVSTPTEIDDIWGSVIESTRSGPCRMMDETGLDTVAAIEQNYIKERSLPSTHTVDFLRDSYLSRGKLGSKSQKGGFYPPCSNTALHSSRSLRDPCIWPASIVLAADNAVGRAENLNEGCILAFDMKGTRIKPLAADQSLPDGISVDRNACRLFWTCMGLPGKQDGAIYSAYWDGTAVEAVLPVGSINTPKQLCVDQDNHQLYFADREGKRIYRCDYGGSNLEVLVDNVTDEMESERQGSHLLEAVDWCVGIAVSFQLRKIFWSQKGPSKSGMGRIFSAGIDIPAGQSAKSRSDQVCILHGLPEPIHLDIDEDRRMLYWTDRGELPLGNSVNRVQLNELGMPLSSHTVLVRNLREAIGIKLDLLGERIFFADSGGQLYSSRLDGTDRKTVYSGQENFTGIALL